MRERQRLGNVMIRFVVNGVWGLRRKEGCSAYVIDLGKTQLVIPSVLSENNILNIVDDDNFHDSPAVALSCSKLKKLSNKEVERVPHLVPPLVCHQIRGALPNRHLLEI